MARYIKIFFSLLAAVLLTACSYDDLPWEGLRNTEEEVVIPFSTDADYIIGSETRSTDTEPAYSVEQVDLIVFSGGSFMYHKTYNKGTDFTADEQLVKVSRSAVADGNWYLVANAGTKVSTFAAESNGANRTEANFKTTVLATEAEILNPGAGKNTMLYAVQNNFTVPEPNQAASEVFELRRLYAKITVKVAPECKNFLVKGTRFYAEDSKVALSGDPAKLMKLAASTLYAPGTGNTTTTLGQTHLSTSGSIDFYVLPMATGMTVDEDNAPYKYAEPRLLLAGRRVSDRDDEDNILALDDADTYYAYQLPQAIEAGHSYTMTLESIQGQGKGSAADAFDDPVGAVVTFKDNTEKVNTIITDGERVIAVADSVFFDAGTADLVNQKIVVHWRGKANDEITFPTDNFKNDSIPGWITNLTSVTDNDGTPSTEETGKSLVRKTTTFTFTVKTNGGSEREFIMPFCFKDKRSLRTETVITQKAANLNLSDYFTIKLKITRGASSVELSETDYLTFLEGTLQGIDPEDNGGRIRNNGIHLPMPNSESGTPVTYTYTITPKTTGWSIDSKPTDLDVTTSGGAFKIEVKDTEYPLNSAMAMYEVYKDGLKLKKGTQTINLDIYHTGFFSKSGTSWYYYEVFNAGGSYWLDRNVGATSSGMAHLEDNYLSGSWPLDDNAAGSYISFAEASKAAASNTVCPKGYRLPTQGDFEKLSMQRTFSSDRLSTGAKTIFVPNFRLTYNVFRDGRATSNVVSFYFPHNRYKHHTQGISGDEGAGYYLTSTGTDTEGYYRVMKFIGMNTTATNLNFGSGKTDRLASLRCVSVLGARVDNTTFTYSCQCKGYTHVFLYHVAKDGTKTFLNTWPGQEVAIGTMATSRYNPFSYTSYVDLNDNDGKLFVIFNKVVGGEVTESNVIEKARNDRQGIPFMNGDAYDYSFAKMTYQPAGYNENIVDQGAWKNNSSGQQTTTYEYRIWGSLSGANSDWKDLGKFTNNGDGTYTISGLNFTANGKFVVSQRKIENGSAGAWKDSWGKAQTTSTQVVLGTPMNLYANTANNYDFRFSSSTAGNATIKLKPSATHATAGSTITVTTGGGGDNPDETTSDYVKILGYFKDAGGTMDNWDVSKAVSTVTPDNNKYIYRFTASKNGSIYFRLVVDGKEVGPDWNNGNNTTVPTTGPDNGVTAINDYSNWGDKKEWTAYFENGKTYEITYWKEWGGNHRISISIKQ